MQHQQFGVACRRPTGWNQFGWQGISFLKPDSWEIGKVEGGENKGHVRLDDQFFSRLELWWQRQGREVSLEKSLTRHLRDLRRKAGRAKIDFRVLENRDYASKTFKGKYFIWEGDFRAINIMVQCNKCWRVVLIRILGKRGEDIKEKAKMLFNSLRDHINGNKMSWSVFDFQFTTPPELRLNQHSFLSGHLKLNFLRDRDNFIFERLSTANIILKEKNISQWARDFCESQYRSVDIGVNFSREGVPEEGVYTIGRERGKIKFFKKRFFKSLFWHCHATNHIFGIIELVRNRDASYLDNLASGVRCH